MSFTKREKFFGKTMSAAVAISQAVLRVPNAVLSIASRMNVSTRAVENWISGATAPSAENLITLIAEFDEVADAVLEMTGRAQNGLTHQQRSKLLEILGDK